MTQPDISVDPHPTSIGSSVSDKISQSTDLIGIHGLGLSHETEYATHELSIQILRLQKPMGTAYPQRPLVPTRRRFEDRTLQIHRPFRQFMQ